MSFNIGPLKHMHEYYKSYYDGYEWTGTDKALPKIGYMVYLVIHDQSKLSIFITTDDEKARGYLGEDGWHLFDGTLVTEPKIVERWKYDETSKNRCKII